MPLFDPSAYYKPGIGRPAPASAVPGSTSTFDFSSPAGPIAPPDNPTLFGSNLRPSAPGFRPNSAAAPGTRLPPGNTDPSVGGGHAMGNTSVTMQMLLEAIDANRRAPNLQFGNKASIQTDPSQPSVPFQDSRQASGGLPPGVKAIGQAAGPNLSTGQPSPAASGPGVSYDPTTGVYTLPNGTTTTDPMVAYAALNEIAQNIPVNNEGTVTNNPAQPTGTIPDVTPTPTGGPDLPPNTQNPTFTSSNPFLQFIYDRFGIVPQGTGDPNDFLDVAGSISRGGIGAEGIWLPEGFENNDRLAGLIVSMLTGRASEQNARVAEGEGLVRSDLEALSTGPAAALGRDLALEGRDLLGGNEALQEQRRRALRENVAAGTNASLNRARDLGFLTGGSGQDVSAQIGNLGNRELARGLLDISNLGEQERITRAQTASGLGGRAADIQRALESDPKLRLYTALLGDPSPGDATLINYLDRILNLQTAGTVPGANFLESGGADLIGQGIGAIGNVLAAKLGG